MTGAPWLDDDGKYVCYLCDVGKTPSGRQRDPDSAHKGLREAHALLWSRPVPGRESWAFTSPPGWYLRSVTLLEKAPAEWCAGSDNFATTHTNALPDLASRIPGYVGATIRADAHLHEFCTIGGYIVFPGALDQQRPTAHPARRWTMNQAKGCDPHVADRMDLTLEAIRLYYDGETRRVRNPLGDVIDAYGWFFDYFGTHAKGFQNYIDYFFLNPFVVNGEVVPLYGDRLDFNSALPRDSERYYLYISAQLAAVTQRNHLITNWWQENCNAG
jgi:hypothetical protein